MLDLLTQIGEALKPLLPDRNVCVSIYHDFQAEDYPAGTVLVMPQGMEWTRTSRGGLIRVYAVRIVLFGRIESEDEFRTESEALNTVATALMENEIEVLGDFACHTAEEINPGELDPAITSAWARVLQVTMRR